MAPRRTRRTKDDGRRLLREIGRLESDKWKILYPKRYGETFQEDIIVQEVKSSAHIK